jgi:hypothetical protein
MLIRIEQDGSIATSGERFLSYQRSAAGDITLISFGHPYFLDKGHTDFWASADQLCSLWSRHGASLVEQLDGTFGIVVVDGSTRCLDVITDRFGTHHLFYAWAGRTLLIGDRLSEIAAALPKVDLDRRGIQSFLLYGMILDDLTVFDGVRKLSPASNYHLDLGRGTAEFVVGRHWQAAGSPEEMTEGEAVEFIAETFTETLQRSAASLDVSLTIPLTSGKDSRTILSALAGHPGVHCYTHGDPSDPDAMIAADVARRAGVSHSVYALDDRWIDSIMDNGRNQATAFNGSIDHIRFLHVLNSYGIEESRGGCFYPGAWANEIWEGKYLRPEFLATTTPGEAADVALGVIEDARGSDYTMFAEHRDDIRGPFVDHLERVIRIDPNWSSDRTSTSIRLVQHTYSPHFFSAFSSYLAKRFVVFHSFIQRPIVEAMPAVPIALQKRAGLQHEVILRNRPDLADLPLFSEGVYRYIPATIANRMKDRIHMTGVPRKLDSVLERVLGRGFFNRRYFVDYQGWLADRHCEQVIEILGAPNLRCGDLLDLDAVRRLLKDFGAGSLQEVRPLSHPLTRLLSLELFLRAVV